MTCPKFALFLLVSFSIVPITLSQVSVDNLHLKKDESHIVTIEKNKKEILEIFGDASLSELKMYIRPLQLDDYKVLTSENADDYGEYLAFQELIKEKS